MMEAPEIVKDVHLSFIKVGSQVITTNSYALIPFHIGEEAVALNSLVDNIVILSEPFWGSFTIADCEASNIPRLRSGGNC